MKGLGAIVLGLVGAIALRLIGSPLPAQALDVGQAVAPADAMLVPGGDPNYERTIRAVRLWREGAAPVIVFSGAGGPGDSGSSMAAEARQLGLPEHAIRIEGRSYSTHENMVLSAPILRALGARRVLLVSSPLHLLRATLAAHRVMPEIAFVPVAARETESEGRLHRSGLVREYLKLVYYVLRRYV